MTVLGGIGFTAPWLLLALLALPLLWLILRAIPPAPIRRRFPGVALLLGLTDDESVSDRTPWWLLMLRMLAVAAIIVGLAGPALNPGDDQAQGDGPLLIVLDGSWAGATHWTDQAEAIEAQLTRASRAGRTVAFLEMTQPEPPVFQAADVWRSRLPGLSPAAWQPDYVRTAEVISIVGEMGSFDTLWFSDGLDFPGRADALAAFEGKGSVEVYQTAENVIALAPVSFQDGAVQLKAIRAAAGPERTVALQVNGQDPAGNAALLAVANATFPEGETSAETAVTLPAELRARITRFDVLGQRSAGATTLADDALRRREIALIANREGREGLQLLSPLHYLEQALSPNADLIRGGLSNALPANPDVIVLADIATLADGEAEALSAWIDEGGMLVRFAGPRVAASDISRAEEDPLMPVRLRTGGRTVGGAMSWGEPKALAPFSESSPFFGLFIPDDVQITSQVMAQPDPTLAQRVIAQLTDGTPLVTRKPQEQGQIVLFHVTATADWSTLPLSGLFVQMLERLAVASSATRPDAEQLDGTTWTPEGVMDGYGTLSDAGNLPGVPGPDLISAPPSAEMQPGIYVSEERRLARNVVTAETVLKAATWPPRIPVKGFAVPPEQPIAGWLLSLAIIALLADVIASLALTGRLTSQSGRAAAMLVGASIMFGNPTDVLAQSAEQDAFAQQATEELVLAHVLTGNESVDDLARAGLFGLSQTLIFRTSVEPADPVGVNLETDELAFFPFLYWPVTPDQPTPFGEAYAKLNAYLRSGGMILFDTRDADIARFGVASPNGRKLQRSGAPSGYSSA